MIFQIIGYGALLFALIQFIATWIGAFSDKPYDRIYKMEMMAIAWFILAVLALK